MRRMDEADMDIDGAVLNPGTGDPNYETNFPYRDWKGNPFKYGFSTAQISYLISALKAFADESLKTAGAYGEILVVPFDGLDAAAMGAKAGLELSLDLVNLAYYQWSPVMNYDTSRPRTKGDLYNWHASVAPDSWREEWYEIYYQEGADYVLLTEANFASVPASKPVFIKEPFLAEKNATSGPLSFTTTVVRP